MSFKPLFAFIIIVLLLYALFTVGLPFLLALLLALLLEPVIGLISNKIKIKRGFISLFVCAIFTVLILILGYILVSKIITEAIGLSNTLLSFTHEINDGIGQLGARYQHLLDSLPFDYYFSLQSFTNSILESLQFFLRQSVSLAFSMAKQIPNLFIQVLITFIGMFLISLHLPKARNSFLSFFDPEVHFRVNTVIQDLNYAVFGFLRAQIIISTLEFFFVLAGFLLLDVKFPSLMALIVTFVDLLPILGTGAVMIPMSIFYGLTGNIFLCIGVFIHYVIIMVFRRVIDPKILGDAMGISALSTLISMYIGLKLAGVIGLFLGPTVVILFNALQKVGILNIKIKF